MKLTKNDIQNILRLYDNQVYNDEAKEQWIRLGKKLCRLVAEGMGLTKGQFEVRVCRGGIAVGAGVSLYTPAVYINFEPSCVGRYSFYWRTCARLGDSGTAMKHVNRKENIWDVLLNVDEFVERVKAVYVAEIVRRAPFLPKTS